MPLLACIKSKYDVHNLASGRSLPGKKGGVAGLT